MHLPAEILNVEESQLHATQLHAMLEEHDVHSAWITTGDSAVIEAGKFDLEVLDFDLRTTLETVMDIFAKTTADKNIELALLTLHEEPSVLRGDPDRLRQILINFVGNAVKFTEKGEAVVRVTVAEETTTHVLLRFEVRDTGIGIPVDRMNRLFQSFSQVDNSSTRKYGGTGLGLAISKKLAELMEGQAGVESEVSKGSTFWFTAKFEKRLLEAAPAKVTRTDLHGLRALVVDDNHTNLTILQHQLTSWGMEVELASSGAQALKLIETAEKEQRNFHIGVFDWQMPEMDGFEATEQIRIRERQAGIRTTIIALTAHAIKGDRERCLAAGMDDYLTKPINPKALQAVLEKWKGKLRAAPRATRHVTDTGEPVLSPLKPRVPPFQLETALERLGGDRKLLAEMADLFLQDCDGYLVQIQQDVANGDKQSLMMAAHTLKGSASNFAATPTCAAAMALEKIGRDGNLSHVPRLVHELETALPNLTSALEQLCQDMAA